MSKQFPSLGSIHRTFIARQKIFFAASAAPGARVNLSPRGTDALRVLAADCVVWLDLTGSSNETAAHLAADGRLTLMFCAFEGPPMILRLYGQGRVIRRGTPDYAELLATHYDGDEPRGARQMIRLDVDLVQTSCGYGVPRFESVGPRDQLDHWVASRTDAELEDYRRRKNAVSIDGLPTGLFDDVAPPRA
ncbi:pyridoxamine 5'-phosphate oxidase family protein [Siculibacillus lacustris]|uniref:Pyridoxamine 5'-phosphate oxidase family protein n=1 Tax=Siculibacillus lacustris TaxID=1549641 RepID=A0A4Q9VY47_9HYPH|nr:pyridoxamine 5'-phosphate oxidase family protein [Siculibacillus lacustris]TBW40892.1 pyridoxamine 5'-phosphate oxidase family protein [Siculibacillus lacustris]